jgi:hypothetical protein
LPALRVQALEFAREVEQGPDLFLAVVTCYQVAGGELRLPARLTAVSVSPTTERIVERDAERHRDQLGDAVDETVRMAKHAAAVAHDRLRRHRAVGDDLADAVAAVLVGDVVDDVVAPSMQKSTSKSGIDTRSGFRKRSNSRP